jgi:hypothetical protein
MAKEDKSKTILIRPKVAISGLGDLGDSVSSVVITSGINTLPEIIVGLHSAGKAASQAKPPLAQKEMEAFRAFQDAQIRGTSPQQEVSISVYDDTEMHYFYKNYSSLIAVAPAFSVQSSFFDKGIKLVDGTVKLNRMAPSIYASVPIKPGDEQTTDERAGRAELEIEAGMNFLDMYVAVLKARMDEFEAAKAGGYWPDAASKEYAELLHGQNVKYFNMLELIRENSKSESTYKSLKKILEGNTSAFVKKSLGDFIAYEVLTPSEDFFSGFLSFLGNTQSFYEPPSEEFIHGRVRPFRVMADPRQVDRIDAEEETTCTYIAFTGTVNNCDTVTSVLIQGVPIMEADVAEMEIRVDLPFTTQSTLYWLQNGSDEGVVKHAPFIPWLSEKLFMENTFLFDDLDNAPKPLSGAGYLSKQSERSNRARKVFQEGYKALLEEYTQNFLGNMQLAPYSMVMKVPLGLHWRPGLRYKMTVLQGSTKIKFNGFLSNVRHSIELTGEANCSTLLQFSHVVLN